LIIFGLIMLDVIKVSIFKGRVTAFFQKKVGDRGLLVDRPIYSLTLG
jgi:hypothetical protein